MYNIANLRKLFADCFEIQRLVCIRVLTCCYILFMNLALTSPNLTWPLIKAYVFTFSPAAILVDISRKGFDHFFILCTFYLSPYFPPGQGAL